MKRSRYGTCLLGVMVVFLAVSCAATQKFKTFNPVYMWKDEAYTKKIDSVMVITAAQMDYMRDHFEKVMSNRLAEHGVEATPSHSIFSGSTDNLNRETIAAKVRQLGIKNVMVARVLSKEEHSRMTAGRYDAAVAYFFMDGWENTYSGVIVVNQGSGMNYDAEFFDILVNLYDAESQKLVWSDMVRVKVEQSRQGAINPLIDLLIQHLQTSKLI